MASLDFRTGDVKMLKSRRIGSNHFCSGHDQRVRLNVLDTLDQIVAANSVQDSSRKVEAVQRQIELSPSNTIWISDIKADIDAARYIGVKIIAVTGGLRSETYLRSLKPDRIVSDLQAINLEEINPC